MSAQNRASRINKLHTLLKKRYKPQQASPGRSLFDIFLYACLLEDASQDAADEGIAKLEQDYFDWNEVRVTTVSELSEVLSHLPASLESASRLKKNLHALFEKYFKFDIEVLKKENLGKTVKEFEEFPGMTPFVLSYTIQHGLGGHAIPINSAGFDIFYFCGIISLQEYRGKKVPGIERAIPKSKGIDFGSILHQFSLDYAAKPKDAEIRKLILGVNPEATELFPDTKKPKPKPAAKPKAPTKKAAEKTTEAAEPAPASKKAAAKKTTAKKATASAAKPTKKKAATKKITPTKKKTAAKKTTAKKVAPKKKSAPVKKKAAASKATKKKAASKAKSKATPAKAKKKASKGATKRLAKKKPR